jgi:hypothetical protein
MTSTSHLTTNSTSSASGRSPDVLRGTSRAAGILYLVTFVSMPTLILYNPVRQGSDFLLGAGSSTGVLWAALSEVVVALAGIGTAVVLFPVVKRQSETAALGFVTSRVVEGSLILLGVVSVLSMITLRSEVTSGVDTAYVLNAGHSLVTQYNWTFLLSQSLMPVFNALCLGSALYRSGLVPRILPLMGLVGAPMLLAADLAIFFGVIERNAPITAIAVIPIAVWEFSLGVYLTVKGFKPAAVAALPVSR